MVSLEEKSTSTGSKPFSSSLSEPVRARRVGDSSCPQALQAVPDRMRHRRRWLSPPEPIWRSSSGCIECRRKYRPLGHEKRAAVGQREKSVSDPTSAWFPLKIHILGTKPDREATVKDPEDSQH